MENKALLEALANLAHEQWAGWMVYLFGKGTYSPDGSWTMPKEFVDRWTRQMLTDYEELSEPEMDSDRKEARKFMKVIDDVI